MVVVRGCQRARVLEAENAPYQQQTLEDRWTVYTVPVLHYRPVWMDPGRVPC